MGNIKEDKALGIDYPSEACSFCGGGAEAVWRLDFFLMVCGECATRELARLVADTVWFDRDHLLTCAEETLNRFHAEFWKGIAIRLNNSRRGGG